MYVMIMAMTAGICTSMTYEAIILKFRENFTWKLAYQTAFSMSILSMLGMEFSENITDYLLTKGEVPVSDPWFWGALAISMMVGFLLPWLPGSTQQQGSQPTATSLPGPPQKHPWA